jgi:hypothetical protein
MVGRETRDSGRRGEVEPRSHEGTKGGKRGRIKKGLFVVLELEHLPQRLATGEAEGAEGVGLGQSAQCGYGQMGETVKRAHRIEVPVYPRAATIRAACSFRIPFICLNPSRTAGPHDPTLICPPSCLRDFVVQTPPPDTPACSPIHWHSRRRADINTVVAGVADELGGA